MKINLIIFLECLAYLSLIPFSMVVTYDLLVFYASSKGGGDALALAVISAITYGFVCVIAVPSIIYILYISKKRNFKIKFRIRFLLGLIVGVIVIPPIYIFIGVNT